jgi:hypothetical protein
MKRKHLFRQGVIHLGVEIAGICTIAVGWFFYNHQEEMNLMEGTGINYIPVDWYAPITTFTGIVITMVGTWNFYQTLKEMEKEE